jgi:ribosome-associated protein
LPQLLGQRVARPRRVVRDEADAMSGVAQPPDRRGGAWNRFPGHVQDTVDVEQNRRHMPGESIRVNSRVAIPLTEVAVRTSRSSGPGGQHAQKTESRVEVVFEVLASEALTDAQKERVVGRVGPVLRAVAQDERSQARNRELALERLAAQLRDALRVRRARRPTKPSPAAVERRLGEKRRRGETKRLRRELDE